MYYCRSGGSQRFRGGGVCKQPFWESQSRSVESFKAGDKYCIDLLLTVQKGLPVKSHRNSLIRHRFLLDVLFMFREGCQSCTPLNETTPTHVSLDVESLRFWAFSSIRKRYGWVSHMNRVKTNRKVCVSARLLYLGSWEASSWSLPLGLILLLINAWPGRGSWVLNSRTDFDKLYFWTLTRPMSTHNATI